VTAIVEHQFLAKIGVFGWGAAMTRPLTMVPLALVFYRRIQIDSPRQISGLLLFLMSNRRPSWSIVVES